MAFSLTKWYLDGVDDAGNVVIAYWARLSMHGAALTWHAMTSYPTDASARHAWSIKEVAPPRHAGSHVGWHAPALGITVDMRAVDVPHDVTLLRRADGLVHWSGQTRSAVLRIARSGEDDFVGRGYAECLTLTIPPWQLPIDALQWGRWIAHDGAHASTWFRWRGAHDLQHLVEDARDACDVSIEGTDVTSATSTLRLQPIRTLEHRSLREILSPLPMVTRVIPDSMLSLEETKWIAHGERTDADGSVRRGFAIYESVVFR